MDRPVKFSQFRKKASASLSKNDPYASEHHVEEMHVLSGPRFRSPGGQDEASETSLFVPKSEADIPNSLFEEKTRRQLIFATRAVTILLLVFMASYITTTILCSLGVICPGDDDDDDHHRFRLPCVECDGTTLITNMAEIRHNLTIGDHLMVDRIWLLNVTSQEYIDVFEHLNSSTTIGTSLPCAECVGDTLVVTNNINATNNVFVGGDTILNGSVSLVGDPTTDMLVVNISSWFYDNVVFHESVTVLGNTYLNNSVFIEGNATVDMFVVRVPTWFYEEVVFHNNITVLGDATFNNSVFIEGNSTSDMVVVRIPTWFYDDVVFHENVTVLGTTELGNTIIDNTTGTEMFVVYPPSWFYGTATFHNQTNMTVLTVNTVNLLNYTSNEYFDLFLFLDNLTMMQNMIKQTLQNHTTRIENIENFINNLAIDNCTVIQLCGPEADVGAALIEAAALLPSITNRVGLEFCPGVYVVNNTGGPLTVPAFVSMTARVPGSVIITPDIASNAVFDLEGDTTIDGLGFTNGLSYITQSGYDGTMTRIAHCFMEMGSRFFTASSTAAFNNYDFVIYLENLRLIGDSGSATQWITFDQWEDGRVYLSDIIFIHVDNVPLGTGIKISGSPTFVQLTDLSFVNVETGIFMLEPPESFVGNGIYARNVSLAVMELFSNNNTNPLHFNGLDTDATVANEYYIHNTNSMPVMVQFGDVHTYNCTEGPKSPVVDSVYLETHADNIEDASMRVLTDMSVGAPEKPHTSTTGTGKHTSRNLLVYMQTGNAAALRVDKLLCRGIPQTMGISVNSSLYMAVNAPDGITGGEFQHFGAMFDVETAAASAFSDPFITEFWDGTEWREFTAMEYDYNFPHAARGDDLFTQPRTIVINYDYRLRTGFTAYNSTPANAWTASDPVGYGADLMWVRFRVEKALTTGPEFSYVAHTGNAHEFLDFGAQLLHGHARRKDSLHYPTNQTLTDLQTSHVTFAVAGETDTSSPFLLKIFFASSDTGNFAFNVTYSYYAPGDSINVLQFIDTIDPKRRVERIDGAYLTPNVIAMVYQELQFEHVQTFNGALAPYIIRIEIQYELVLGGMTHVDLITNHITYVKHMEGEALAWV